MRCLTPNTSESLPYLQVLWRTKIILQMSLNSFWYISSVSFPMQISLGNPNADSVGRRVNCCPRGCLQGWLLQTRVQILCCNMDKLDASHHKVQVLSCAAMSKWNAQNSVFMNFLGFTYSKHSPFLLKKWRIGRMFVCVLVELARCLPDLQFMWKCDTIYFLICKGLFTQVSMFQITWKAERLQTPPAIVWEEFLFLIKNKTVN